MEKAEKAGRLPSGGSVMCLKRTVTHRERKKVSYLVHILVAET